MKIKILSLFSLLLILSSCLSKGSKNVSGESAPQDITISLLKVSPPSVVLGPSETTQFDAIGGTPPYTYSLENGYGSIDEEGNYFAAASLGNSTIRVTDTAGNSVFAFVTVGSSLQISPTTKTLGTNDTFTLSAIGGVSPYSYSIVSGGGSINTATGFFTAPGTPQTVSIQVRDGNDSIAYSTLTIVDSLTVTPSTLTIEDNTSYTFDVAGGNPPYSFQVYAGSGSIDSAGEYTAPISAGTEVIRITDSNSNFVEATITVALGPNLSAGAINLAPGTETTISTSEGTAPFIFTVESGTGSVHPSTGGFTAPTTADLTTVRCTDANGFTDEINIQSYNLKKLALGDNFACMLHVHNNNTTSDFKCWGGKENGIFGDENEHIGDTTGEMGDNLNALDFGSGNTPVGVYSSNYYHNCALFSNGRAKCWGYGNSGRLGIGNQTNKGEVDQSMGSTLPFIQIGTGETIDTVLDISKRLSLGSEHTCTAIDTDSIKCFGNGAQGRSGNGNQTDYCNGAGNCNDNMPELNLGTGKSIAQLVAGHEHSCAIIAPDNQVKCWGEANYGRLGSEGTTDQIVTPDAASFIDLGTGRSAKYITAGYHHTCVILDDDSVKCWGRNNYGQLGQGDTTQQGDDSNEMGDNLNVTDLGSVSYPVSLHSKGYHTCAIFNNGGLKCWGRNNYGQLGYGNTASLGDGGTEMGDNLNFIDVGTGETVVSVDVSERTTCVITNANNLKCWGDNDFGQLGIENTDRIGNNGSEMGDNLASVDLGTSRYATMVGTSIYSTCALLDDSTVKCWGRDYYGNLGTQNMVYGDESSETLAALSNIDLGSGQYAKDIFSGRTWVCAILMTNELKCFGAGGNGRLGQGNSNNIGDQEGQMGDSLASTDLGTGLYPIQGSGWSNHTCSVLNTGDVKCWGDGANGRRGSGDQNDRGDGANEMGDNLSIVNLGSGRTATKVETGNAHSCALLDNNQIKCWGHNNVGKLGIGNTSQKGHSGVTTPDTYTTVSLGTSRSAKDISVGHDHTCAILDNDRVKCWGEGSLGRLGGGNQNDIGDASGEIGDGMPYVDLGTNRTAVKIATGIYHSCALLDNQKIKCWGDAGYGQLGIGSNADRGDGANEMGDNLPYVLLPSSDKPAQIYAGGYYTCTVLESNDIKCWGRNNSGQLGHGHIYDVGVDALSMENNLPITD